jgi:hypothetical protein
VSRATSIPQGTRHLVAPELVSATPFGIGGDHAPQVELHARLRRDALARAFLN